jgi:Acyl carrier protein
MELVQAKSERIKSVIINIISKQFSIDSSEITERTDIPDDLGADSLDVVEILMEIEDELGVCIPDSDVLELKTIENVVSYLSQRVSESDPVLNT